MTRRGWGWAIAMALLLGVVGWAPSTAAAAPSAIDFNHRCGWWNDWCNNNTTTTTTTTTPPPPPTTTTTSTTTTLPPPPPTTTTTQPTTTTSPPTTTTSTTTTTTTLPVVQQTNPPPPSTTTTTTQPTTTTSRADAVGFFADFNVPRGLSPEQVSADAESRTGIELLVSLIGAFVGMTVQGLGYYLFVFLVPVLAAIWLSVIRRRDEQVVGEA